MSVPKIIAHRGASGSAPENTEAAFRRAAELGATWIETDCMLNLDGAIMLHHDDTAERLTGDKRAISGMSLLDIKSLDAGSLFDPVFADETIITLDELVGLLREIRLGVNLEIKPAPGFELETARRVANRLNIGWPESLPQPLISSFSYDALKLSKELAPQFEHAMLWEKIPDDWQHQLESLHASAVHCKAQNLEQQVALDIVKAGYPLRCYTVNEQNLADKLFSWGVSSIFTDFPEKFV